MHTLLHTPTRSIITVLVRQICAVVLLKVLPHSNAGDVLRQTGTLHFNGMHLRMEVDATGCVTRANFQTTFASALLVQHACPNVETCAGRQTLRPQCGVSTDGSKSVAAL